MWKLGKMAKSLREHLFTKETSDLLENKKKIKKKISVVLVQQKVVCRCVIWISSPRRFQKTLAKHGTNIELTMIMANALSSLPLLYTYI